MRQEIEFYKKIKWVRLIYRNQFKYKYIKFLCDDKNYRKI